MTIASRQQLEAAALHYGMLPFFANRIAGFSVQEMAAPGMLFGESADETGCWEWKGPVIQEQTTAYGKFFNRKAGFVAAELLPDFLNYRRAAYPLKDGSTDRMLLDLIRANEGITSTGLKRLVFGAPRRRKVADPFDLLTDDARTPRPHGLETPLQRLQMGGWILIADFEYKHSADGRRYGWGVALYSTPEIWFDREFACTSRTPDESFALLVNTLASRLPGVEKRLVAELIR